LFVECCKMICLKWFSTIFHRLKPSGLVLEILTRAFCHNAGILNTQR